MPDWWTAPATSSSTTACSASAGADAGIVSEGVAPEDYREFIGEATVQRLLPESSVLQAAWLSRGIYRVGPLARLNVAEAMGTPRRRRRAARIPPALRRVPHSSFHYHYARLIEMMYALERYK